MASTATLYHQSNPRSISMCRLLRDCQGHVVCRRGVVQYLSIGVGRHHPPVVDLPCGSSGSQLLCVVGEWRSLSQCLDSRSNCSCTFGSTTIQFLLVGCVLYAWNTGMLVSNTHSLSLSLREWREWLRGFTTDSTLVVVECIRLLPCFRQSTLLSHILRIFCYSSFMV
jgi:hypothetical protein